jgi:uncharacterized repeat protein (TIGR04076 family)
LTIVRGIVMVVDQRSGAGTFSQSAHTGFGRIESGHTLTVGLRQVAPAGGHFCLYALAAVLPLLPAKQRQLPARDWLERDALVACPDPEERLIMRITRTGRRPLRSSDLT